MAKPEKPKQQDLKPKDDETVVSGVTLVADATIPPGEAHAKDSSGKTVGVITGIGDDVENLRAALQREKQRADAADKERADLDGDRKVLLRDNAALAKENDALEQKVASLTADLERLTEPQPSLPESGWSSPRARELVQAVPVVDQPYLLGDLLAQLAPHAGETGANETAADVCHRVLSEVEVLRGALAEASEAVKVEEMRAYEAERRAAGAQNALIARRAPDAMGTVTLGHMTSALTEAGVNPSGDGGVVAAMKSVLSEWKGLRAFFSDKPLVALAVKDESTPAVADRFSLLLLEWDGKRLSPTALETVRPWGDIHPRLQHMLNTRLVPKPFR